MQKSALPAAAKNFFECVEALLPARLLRGEGTPAQYADAVKKLADGTPEKVVADIEKALASGMGLPDKAQRESWKILQLHTEQFLLAYRAFHILWGDGVTAAEPAVAALLDWAREHESVLQKVFDVYEYLSVTITVTGVDRERFMNRLGKEKESDLAEI